MSLGLGLGLFYSGGSGGGVPFTPADIPDLALWLDASDASTITQTGGSVSQWNDKSGNGYNATQATGVSQPLTGSETINSLNTLVFDGSNDFMSLPSGAWSIPNGDYTVYTLAANRISSANGALYDFRSGSSGLYYRYDFNNTTVQFKAGLVKNNNFTYLANTMPNVETIIKTGAAASAYRGAQTGLPIAATPFTATGARIGSFTTGSPFANIKFGEMIVYNRSIAYGGEEDLQIRAYLLAKWGV